VEVLELVPMKGETVTDCRVFLNCCLSLINVIGLGKMFVNDSSLTLIGHNIGIAAKFEKIKI
jgi:hypothetical protein